MRTSQGDGLRLRSTKVEHYSPIHAALVGMEIARLGKVYAVVGVNRLGNGLANNASGGEDSVPTSV